MSIIGWVDLNPDGWTGVDKFRQGWMGGKKGGRVALAKKGGRRGGWVPERVDGWIRTGGWVD